MAIDGTTRAEPAANRYGTRLMQYPAAHFVYDLGDPPALPPQELTQLLGSKAANVVVMANQLGLPVPPGFAVSAEACREYLAGRWPAGLDDELRLHTERLGERVGRRFGDPAGPLLVSVRSGAAVSMPGMMDTILNLGLNSETVRGLARATGSQEFADDCLRRFRAGYRQVLGTDDVPDDPWRQLRQAVEAVFRSWNSERAKGYRRREQIPDDLGTAVTVQAMVFGNRGDDSGTGVLFTRDPATGERKLYGDIMFNAQGEDVVAGGKEPEPLEALEERMPEVARQLREYAQKLERHYADLCDIEFTIEQGRLWLLQVRIGKRSPLAALRMAIEMAQDDDFPCSREEAVRRVASYLQDPPKVFVRPSDGPPPLAIGLPASPGVATGAIVTSADAAEAAAEKGQAVILVRAETSPEDVRGMSQAAGVLTSRGGLASHAAVVARGWGIPAVVGAASVEPRETGIQINGRWLGAGVQITIDGGTGEIYLGDIGGSWDVAPEAATLLGWARELGIEVGGGQPAAPVVAQGVEVADEATDTPAPSHPAGPLEADDVLRALLIKGSVSIEDMVATLLAQPNDAQAAVDELLAQKLVEAPSSGLRLTGEGKLRALDVFAADRGRVGEATAVDLLEDFHPFDVRMKDIVTSWQVREVGGEQTFNDHTDPEYDAGILAKLGTLHEETVDWLAPLAGQFRRYAAYRSRLERALAAAREGDQRYVASPRVDSYHSVWFELHEDLIRLAGRRRTEEGAAGRA